MGIGVYKDMGIEIRVTAGEKNIFKIEGTYDEIASTFRMFAAQQQKVLFDVTSGYNKFINAFKVAFAGVTKWGGVYVSTKGQKTIFNFDVMGKAFAKVIINRKDMMLSIQSLRYPKISLNFDFKP